MTSGKNRLIIFNTQNQPLGEMLFDHDLFLQANLLPLGEEALGGWLEEWQVQGILYLHPETGSKQSVAAKGEYIAMHNSAFPSALRQWLEHHDLFSILLPEECLDSWNNILQLPLEQHELFQLGARLSLCRGADLAQFKKSLAKIIAAMEKSQKPAKSLKKTKSSPARTGKKSKSAKPKTAKIKVKTKK